MQKNSTSLVREDVDLAPYNSLNVHARARYFITVQSPGDIRQLIESGRLQSGDFFVLGGGSNILFLDDFPGIVVHIGIKGREIVHEDEQEVHLSIGAGENWHETVLYCVDRGWGGIENLSLIPGTVGAAPIQNIGAYGVELEEVFESLKAVHIKSGKIKTFNREECRFEYRDSVFKNELKGQYIITSVTLRLSKNPVLNTSYGAIQTKLEEKGIEHPSIREISDTVIEIRQSKLPDPSTLGNAGSFFKNPVVDASFYRAIREDFPEAPGYEMGGNKIKVPAGWLIEKTGWKGKVVGEVGTYEQQALVIVNHGNATGAEIWNLAQQIKESVKEMFGIELVPEVNIVGS